MKSLKFPIIIKNGKPVLNTYEETIEDSISSLLDTNKSTTFFNPDYGSKISELFFEQNDDILKNLLFIYITDALKQEHRIKVTSIGFKNSSEVLYCYISYEVVGTNSVYDFTYPFFKNIYK